MFNLLLLLWTIELDAFSFAILGICIIVFKLFWIFGVVGLLNPICVSILTWFGLNSSAGGTVFVSPQSPYRDNDIILWIFLLSFVTCLTLANLQKFGFDFHLRSFEPITCYTVLTRPNKVETAVHGCNSWLSVWTLSCRCPVKLFTW